MKLNKISKLASIISRHIHRSTTKQKHVAAVIKNGKIINVRNNSPGIHAECSVVNSLNKKEMCKTILVIRYENGIFKNSKPCKECICKLRKTVKQIIYSTGDDMYPFIIEKLEDMKNEWQSNLIRRNVKDCVYKV
jgi:hypothetical protein